MNPFTRISNGHTDPAHLPRRLRHLVSNRRGPLDRPRSYTKKVGSSASSSSASIPAVTHTPPVPPPRSRVSNLPAPLDWALPPALPPSRLVGNLPGPLGGAHNNTENFGASASSSSTSIPVVTHTHLASLPHHHVSNLPGPLDWALPSAPSPRCPVGNLPGPLDWPCSNTENFGTWASSSFSSIPAVTCAPLAHPPGHCVDNLPGPLDWAHSNTENFGYSASSSSKSVPAAADTPTAPPPRRRVGNLPGPLDWVHSNTENFGYSASSSSKSVPAAADTPMAPPPRRHVGNRPDPLDCAHSYKKNHISSASSSPAFVPADTTGSAPLALTLPADAPTVSTSVITPVYGPLLEPLFGLSTPEAARFFDQELVDPLPLVFPPFLASPRLEPVVRRPSPEETGFFDQELPVPEILASDAAFAAAAPIVPSPAANTTTVDLLPPDYFSIGSVALAPTAPASFVSTPFAPSSSVSVPPMATTSGDNFTHFSQPSLGGALSKRKSAEAPTEPPKPKRAYNRWTPGPADLTTERIGAAETVGEEVKKPKLYGTPAGGMHDDPE